MTGHSHCKFPVPTTMPLTSPKAVSHLPIQYLELTLLASASASSCRKCLRVFPLFVFFFSVSCNARMTWSSRIVLPQFFGAFHRLVPFVG